MALTVEEFGKALIKTISDNTRGGYVLGSNLISAIRLALVPAGEQGREFPKMLYRRGPGQERDEASIVNDDAELHDALDASLEQGWNRSPSPEPPGYPQNWVEVDFSCGSDYRRVLICNPKEEQLFPGKSSTL